jgi:hypothetical protein
MTVGSRAGSLWIKQLWQESCDLSVSYYMLPEGGAVNWGMYRVTTYDPPRLGMITFAQYSDVPINHGFRPLIFLTSASRNAELPLWRCTLFQRQCTCGSADDEDRFVPAIQLSAWIEDCFADFQERGSDPHVTPVAKRPFAQLSAIASDDFFRSEVVRVRHGHCM